LNLRGRWSKTGVSAGKGTVGPELVSRLHFLLVPTSVDSWQLKQLGGPFHPPTVNAGEKLIVRNKQKYI
jgi:hypothetical protein